MEDYTLHSCAYLSTPSSELVHHAVSLMVLQAAVQHAHLEARLAHRARHLVGILLHLHEDDALLQGHEVVDVLQHLY